MGATWQELSARREKFQTNLSALESLDAPLAERVAKHVPSCEYVIAQSGSSFQLAKQSPTGPAVLSPVVNELSARDIAKKLYPRGQCTEPVLIAGLDQGWLWQALYELPCHTPLTPGHRPPLYFLARDIERLWLLMHVRDWSTLLGDARIRLFVGEDAAEQCRRSMTDHSHIPWPKLCVTVDPAVWPKGVSVDSMWQGAHASANLRMQQISREIEAMYAGLDAKTIARHLRGETLRVLGITSTYTTFLKYSMSDWLDAFTAMGHEAMVVIESADHEINNPIRYAEAVREFAPDLIVLIDHFRAELPGLPQQIPCVMWVQDTLPNIFSPKAGAAQGKRDFCLGFGRLALRDQCGYPEDRFLPAQVGVNDERFAPKTLSESDLQTFGSDVSFVSHASTPATVLITEQLQKTDADGRKLLIDVFEQLRAVYDGGKAITHASRIKEMIAKSLAKFRLRVEEPQNNGLFEFFNTRVNNALFRHQALSWAADMGVNLHIWGRGWEQHPRLGKFAKGIACNQSQLLKIYHGSKINLQIMPSGAVHQRLLDGLAAGAFFLARYCPGDFADIIHRKLWDWCNERQIRTHRQFMEKIDAQVQTWLGEYEQLMGVGLLKFAPDVMAHLKLSADSEFTRSAATIWDGYEHICFDSDMQFSQRVTQFLKDDSARRDISASMRQVVLDRFTYRATTRRLLDMMADSISGDFLSLEAAA